MKINHLKRYLIGIAMTGFLALLAGNAFGDSAESVNASRDFDGGKKSQFANNYMVASPYWQVEGGSSYTFIAVSHSSLSGMASQIGVVVNAITSAKTAYDTAESFTVSAGATQRVFIVPTNHATVNSTNISSAVFLSGTTDFTYGHLRIGPVTNYPQLKTGLEGGGHGGAKFPPGAGFRDPTMLTYWGSVIIEANTTGFAMEFIGDMNDSQTLAVQGATAANGIQTTGNNYMASGVNLQ
jgi:hypothetical protein